MYNPGGTVRISLITGKIVAAFASDFVTATVTSLMVHCPDKYLS
jgi:hypothetical protein